MKESSEVDPVQSDLFRTKPRYAVQDAETALTNAVVIGCVSGSFMGAAVVGAVVQFVGEKFGKPSPGSGIALESTLVLAALGLFLGAKQKWREAQSYMRQLSPKDQILASLTVVEHPKSGEHVLRFETIEHHSKEGTLVLPDNYFKLGDKLQAELKRSIVNPAKEIPEHRQAASIITSPELSNAVHRGLGQPG